MKEPKKDVEIWACMNCGSTDITKFYRTSSDSLFFGGIRLSDFSGSYRCRKCGKIITPLIFDDEAKYKKFVKFRHKELGRGHKVRSDKEWTLVDSKSWKQVDKKLGLSK